MIAHVFINDDREGLKRIKLLLFLEL